MDNDDLHSTVAQLRRDLILSASLYWKQNAPRVVFCKTLDSIISLAPDDILLYTEHGIELFDTARKQWPFYAHGPIWTQVCWNCGYCRAYKEPIATRLLPFCDFCDDNKDLYRPVLWITAEMMRGYLLNRPTRMQIECILLQGVMLAITPAKETSND